MDRLTEAETADRKDQLITEILEHILDHPLTGKYPNRKCKHCHGEDSGYWDSQDFTHGKNCPVKLVGELREIVAYEGS